MDQVKKITKKDFLLNNGENGNRLWILIDGKVYDVTDFNHPGGSEILLDEQGNDRIDEFESIHSPAAKKQMVKYFIGNYDESGDGQDDNKTDKVPLETKNKNANVSTNETDKNSSSSLYLILPVVVLSLAFLIYKFLL